MNYGPNDTQTVTSVQKTKSFRIQEVNEKDVGEWVCRYYGKQGILGNVTYELHVMGRLSSYIIVNDLCISICIPINKSSMLSIHSKNT